jgi:hypothetical protein
MCVLVEPMALQQRVMTGSISSPSGARTLRCTQGEAAGEHTLILCNTIGSPVDSKVMDTEPKFVALTGRQAGRQG